jgi:hypothetical protein
MPLPSPKNLNSAISAIARRRLARILGLPDEASPAQIESALPRLLRLLGGRLDAALENDPESVTRLRREIAELAINGASIVASPIARKSRRRGRLAAVLVGGLILAIFVGYAVDDRFGQIREDNLVSIPTTPGLLLLEGRLAGATLRVLDADRQELFVKMPAEGARVELPPGRVVLDVRREDCPDSWTQSVYFEEGETHRFEPQLCRGFGRLTIRSNVNQTRVRIDGLEMGDTTETAVRLAVGDHELRVDKAGYQSFKGTVRIRPDGELEIYAELVAVGTPRSRPMPVTMHAPTKKPDVLGDPLQFDLPALGESMETAKLDLDPDQFFSLGGRSTGYGGAAPGSTRWHDRVSADLISRYDADASGLIDQNQESEAISCRVWRALEDDFDAGGLGLSLARYFGFDGSEWHPNALGFARAQRSLAFNKMKGCGLQS